MIDIVVNANTLEMSQTSGNIVGEIYLNVDGKVFPDKGWSDFIVIILTWWIEAISKVNTKRKFDSFKLTFMDGPIFIKGYVHSDGNTELEFTRERMSKNEIIFTTVCNISQLKISTIKAAKCVIEQVDKNGWDNADIKKLKCLVKQGI